MGRVQPRVRVRFRFKFRVRRVRVRVRVRVSVRFTLGLFLAPFGLPIMVDWAEEELGGTLT